MPGTEKPERGEERKTPTAAVVAGLALLYAAALAAALVDGVATEPPRSPPVVADAPDTSPSVRLCLRGPGGEVVEFPAEGRGARGVSSGTART